MFLLGLKVAPASMSGCRPLRCRTQISARREDLRPDKDMAREMDGCQFLTRSLRLYFGLVLKVAGRGPKMVSSSACACQGNQKGDLPMGQPVVYFKSRNGCGQ